jgi:hypothetical protein
MQLCDTLFRLNKSEIVEHKSLLGKFFSDPFPFDQYRRSFVTTAFCMVSLLGVIHVSGTLKFLSRVDITFSHRL